VEYRIGTPRPGLLFTIAPRKIQGGLLSRTSASGTSKVCLTLCLVLAHSGLQREHIVESKRLSVTLFAGTPLDPYGIAYGGVYGLFTRW